MCIRDSIIEDASGVEKAAGIDGAIML